MYTVLVSNGNELTALQMLLRVTVVQITVVQGTAVQENLE